MPAGLDKDALLIDLRASGMMFGAVCRLDSPTLAKEQFRRIKGIQTTARQLAQLLRADAEDAGLVQRFYFGKEPDALAVVGLLAEAADRAMGVRTEFMDDGTPVPVCRLAHSPFVWFAGEELPQLFEKHFGKRAGYTTTDGDADGLYLRFADAVLWELGIRNNNGERYMRSSIADALSEVRAGKTRRKRQLAISDTDGDSAV